MDLINGIVNVFSPWNLFYCFMGSVLGTLVGVLPGLGPASTLAILLPITMYLDPTGSIIMMAGLYYGAAYGGATTSILVNIPGEVSSVPTCYDGYPMTKDGRAGQALWIAAVGSFIAGTLGAIGLSILGPGVAKFALRFGPPEYFALLVFSLTALVSLASKSVVKGAAVAVIGLLLGATGVDPMTGVSRFNFGSTAMMLGFDVVPVVVGLFGIAEVLVNAEMETGRVYEGKLGKMMPRGEELRKGLVACLRGTALGLPLGILPGFAPAVGSFLAYDLEKRISKHPEKFGTGVIEGVAGPEAANNAVAQSGFLPLLSLGIPTHPSPAIILAALIMYGVQPGPTLFQLHKEFAWTVIGSMYIGNVMLLVLNLPLIGLWARISVIPYKYLGPFILGICVIGAYSPRNTMFDVWIALAAGLVGYVMKRADWPVAPIVVGFILGPMLEQALRQSLSIGGPLILFTRPISIGFYILSSIMIITTIKIMKRAAKAGVSPD